MGIWGSSYDIPKAIFYLLKGDYMVFGSRLGLVGSCPRPVIVHGRDHAKGFAYSQYTCHPTATGWGGTYGRFIGMKGAST